MYVVAINQDEYISVIALSEFEERPTMSSHNNKDTMQMYTWVINCLFPKGLYRSMLFSGITIKYRLL